MYLHASHLKASNNPHSVMKWFEKLSLVVHARIAITRFTPFIPYVFVRTQKHNKRRLQALVERWMNSTHTLHMPIGEIMIALWDFAYLTGIPYEGRMLEFDLTSTLYRPEWLYSSSTRGRHKGSFWGCCIWRAMSTLGWKGLDQRAWDRSTRVVFLTIHVNHFYRCCELHRPLSSTSTS